MNHARLTVVVLCFAAGAVYTPADARCGRERWAVKTGTDSQARVVNLARANPTTIHAMSLWHAPSPLPADGRIAPAETKVWALDVTLVKYKLEDDPTSGDSDFHLVLTDGHGRRMIAEIPSPDCVGAGSPFADSIRAVRDAFAAKFAPTGAFQTANVRVKIRGVGFFDFAHGQAGHAVNYVELHPVLGITLAD